MVIMDRGRVGVPDDVTPAVMTAIVVTVMPMDVMALIAVIAPVVVAVVTLTGQRDRAEGQDQAEEQYLCHALHKNYSCWLNTAPVCNTGTESPLNPK